MDKKALPRPPRRKPMFIERATDKETKVQNMGASHIRRDKDLR